MKNIPIKVRNAFTILKYNSASEIAQYKYWTETYKYNSLNE